MGHEKFREIDFLKNDNPAFIYIFFLAIKVNYLKKKRNNQIVYYTPPLGFFSLDHFLYVNILRQFLQYYCCSLTILCILKQTKKNNNLFDVDSYNSYFFQ